MYHEGLLALDSQEYVCVTHAPDAGAWAYFNQTDNLWVQFVPEVGANILIASLDFDEGAAISLFNFDGTVDAVMYGFGPNDLLITSSATMLSGS